MRRLDLFVTQDLEEDMKRKLLSLLVGAACALGAGAMTRRPARQAAIGIVEKFLNSNRDPGFDQA